MKVLFVASGNSWSGISPIVLNQGDSLIKAEIDLDYFTVSDKGIKGYWRSLIKLRRHLTASRYDIIHAHYGLCGIIALIARRNEKLVVSFMGDDLLGVRRPDGSVTLASRLVSRINRLLSRLFYDFSIVKSAEMGTKLRTGHSAVIPNGTDLERFFPVAREEALRKTGIEGINPEIALFVSDPARPEKNYSLAEKAVNLVSGIEMRLLTVSGIDNSDLNDYYNAAGLLLLTSFHEGSPNVVKEAMACNCPVVSTDVGDVRWLFGDTEGYRVSASDPGEMAVMIRHAIQFRQDRGYTKGRDRIIELGLDTGTIALKIIKVYREVLNRRS